jgi:hypothetical protein
MSVGETVGDVLDGAGDFTGGTDDGSTQSDPYADYNPHENPLGIVTEHDRENSEYPYEAGEDPAYSPLADTNNDGVVTEQEYEANTTPVTETFWGGFFGGLGNLFEDLFGFLEDLAELTEYWKAGLVLGIIAVVGYILRPLFTVGANATEGGA